MWGMAFSTRLLFQATNLEELSLVCGTPVEQLQPQPVEVLQPVGPVVQPAVEPLQPLGQFQPFPALRDICIERAHDRDHYLLVRAGLNAKRLAQSVRSQKIKKLKLRGYPTSFLTELNPLPELEELQMENSIEREGGLNLVVFLIDHANHLKKLILKNVAHLQLSEDLPLLPKLEYLVFDMPERGIPLVSVSSDLVPALIKIKTTPYTLDRGFFKGFFHSVREIEIYDEGHAKLSFDVRSIRSLQESFTNLKTLRFTEVRNELLSVFKLLQQLEELTVTCYKLNESKLTGINFKDADRIYTRFLKDQCTAEGIQNAARPHLDSVNRNPYCLRDMKRLKKFGIAVDGSPGKTIMSNACIFLSFMLMQPLEVLAVNNIQLPVRGVLQMQECVQKVYRKFSDEPGFNSSD